jgi:hypothetical protein
MHGRNSLAKPLEEKRHRKSLLKRRFVEDTPMKQRQ